MAAFLEKERFAQIVAHTPLVSIDLIVKNSRGEVLLGKRMNEPAKGYWFVPGGRIYKNETISQAFSRIAESEIGQEEAIENAKFLGAYEHFYENSFCSEHISTHYVVLAYELNCNLSAYVLPKAQHNDYKIVPVEVLLHDAKVHPNVKLYFKESK